jgi:hypothetical protein
VSIYPRQQCEHEYPHNPHRVWGHIANLTTRCPGVTIKPGDRVYRPADRRQVLEALRALKKTVEYYIWKWNPDGIVRRANGVDERPRKMSEYPENDREEWLLLHDGAGRIVNAAVTLQRQALEKIRAIDRAAKGEGM